MSDDPPPMSLKERIAALNKQQATTAAPPPVRPKPAFKHKVGATSSYVPPVAPAAPSHASAQQPEAESAEAPITSPPNVDDPAQEEPAQPSVSSLKDRISALQGLKLAGPGQGVPRRKKTEDQASEIPQDAQSEEQPGDKPELALATTDAPQSTDLPDSSDAPASVPMPAMPKRAGPPRKTRATKSQVTSPASETASPISPIEASQSPFARPEAPTPGHALRQQTTKSDSPEVPVEDGGTDQVTELRQLADESGHPSEGLREEPQEEDEVSRRANILKRLQAGGGIRMGMMPPQPALPSKPEPPIKEPEVVEKLEDKAEEQVLGDDAQVLESPSVIEYEEPSQIEVEAAQTQSESIRQPSIPSRPVPIPSDSDEEDTNMQPVSPIQPAVPSRLPPVPTSMQDNERDEDLQPPTEEQEDFEMQEDELTPMQQEDDPTSAILSGPQLAQAQMNSDDERQSAPPAPPQRAIPQPITIPENNPSDDDALTTGPPESSIPFTIPSPVTESLESEKPPPAVPQRPPMPTTISSISGLVGNSEDENSPVQHSEVPKPPVRLPPMPQMTEQTQADRKEVRDISASIPQENDAQSPNEGDDETSRRAALAKRMASMGGVRMGMLPVPPSRSTSTSERVPIVNESDTRSPLPQSSIPASPISPTSDSGDKAGRQRSPRNLPAPGGPRPIGSPRSPSGASFTSAPIMDEPEEASGGRVDLTSQLASMGALKIGTALPRHQSSDIDTDVTSSPTRALPPHPGQAPPLPGNRPGRPVPPVPGSPEARKSIDSQLSGLNRSGSTSSRPPVPQAYSPRQSIDSTRSYGSSDHQETDSSAIVVGSPSRRRMSMRSIDNQAIEATLASPRSPIRAPSKALPAQPTSPSSPISSTGAIMQEDPELADYSVISHGDDRQQSSAEVLEMGSKLESIVQAITGLSTSKAKDFPGDVTDIISSALADLAHLFRTDANAGQRIYRLEIPTEKANPVVEKHEDLRAGNQVFLAYDAKFKAGRIGSHSVKVGGAHVPHIAILVEIIDPKKGKVKVVEMNQGRCDFQTYKFDDLVRGTVEVRKMGMHG